MSRSAVRPLLGKVVLRVLAHPVQPVEPVLHLLGECLLVPGWVRQRGPM